MTIWELFSVLSAWEEKPKEQRKAGLTLELSMHSWSDMEHHFKELQVRANDTAWSMVPEDKRYQTSFNDHQHGWMHGACFAGPNQNELRRVGAVGDGGASDPRGLLTTIPGGVLPKVTAITSVVIRRQFYHGFPCRCLMLVMEHLPNLVWFKYEPAHIINSAAREADHFHLIDLALGPQQGPERLSIFECWHRRIGPLPRVDRHRRRDRMLRQRSKHLEELHVAFFIDAAMFFGPRGRMAAEFLPNWEQLRYLSLTSDYLRGGVPGLSYEAANELIEDAACAARRMPLLNVMELWQTSGDSATLFRYKKRAVEETYDCVSRPLVELKSSWDLRLGCEAEVAWRATAKIHNGDGPLMVRYGTVKAVRRENAVLFLHELESRNKLLSETSYLQMRMEAKRGY